MGEIAPEEQFHPLSTIFYYLMLNFYVKIGIRFSLRDKRLLEITKVEITRVDWTYLVAAVSVEVHVIGQSKKSKNKKDLSEFVTSNCLFPLTPAL